MKMDWPLIMAELGLNKKVTKSAISCGLISLLIMLRLSIFLTSSSVTVPDVMDVSTIPGQIALTRIPAAPSSNAIVFVRLLTAALELPYNKSPLVPTRDDCIKNGGLDYQNY